jgi:hypothetical protein
MIADLTHRPAVSPPTRPPTDTDGALELRRLEREAHRVQRAFAGDPTVRLVVGLDLAIRRAAIRLGQTWRALWD